MPKNVRAFTFNQIKKVVNIWPNYSKHSIAKHAFIMQEMPPNQCKFLKL